MSYWHYFAGLTAEDHSIGSGCLLEVMLCEASGPPDSKTMQMPGDTVLTHLGSWNYEPTEGQKRSLLPLEWQEEFPERDVSTDEDDDEE